MDEVSLRNQAIGEITASPYAAEFGPTLAALSGNPKDCWPQFIQTSVSVSDDAFFFLWEVFLRSENSRSCMVFARVLRGRSDLMKRAWDVMPTSSQLTVAILLVAAPGVLDHALSKDSDVNLDRVRAVTSNLTKLDTEAARLNELVDKLTGVWVQPTGVVPPEYANITPQVP